MVSHHNSRYALLGLLTTGCKTGYEMKQMIDRSLNHFWKQSYGQIYPQLKKLIEDELVSVTTTPQEGKPDRKEYTITHEGMRVLQSWVDEPVKTFPSEKNEYLLKLFFSRHSDHSHTLLHLEQYEKDLKEQLSTYINIEKSIKDECKDHQDPLYWLLTLDFGKRKAQAAIEWCAYARETIMGSFGGND